ncbi:MAG: IclR family transcriptional regulator C-terminal domain-containing protein [Pseudomonadota bacterium]
MSQQIKLIKTLDLFSEDRPTLSAEEIADLLDVSRPTGFRYVRQLCEIGLLTKLSGRYALGPKIIELDYRIRRSEPILLASRERMKELAKRTATTIVLCSLYGDDVINVHHEAVDDPPALSLERGRLMPRFSGSASTIILANLPVRRLRRLYEESKDKKEVLAIAKDWPGFSKYYREIARLGYYISRGRIDAGVTGISAPIFNDLRLVVGSLVIAYKSERSELINEQGYAEMACKYAADITRSISGLAKA